MPGCEVESCEEVDKYEKCKRDELLVDGNQIERVRKSDGVGRRNEFPSSFGEPPKRSTVLESHCDDYFSVRRERKMVLEESCYFKRPPSAKSVIGQSVEKLNSDLPASSSSDDLAKDEVGPVRTIVAAGEFVEDVRSFTCLSHGSISMIGRRRAMEDAVTMLPGVLGRDFKSYDFFGVYDGHGGSSVASACKDRLHHLLAKEVESRTSCGDEMDWKKVMTSCFLKMDEEVFEKQEDVDSTEFTSLGSTAVVVILGTDEVVVANCGDSRAILYRDGVVVPLSRDHKPDLPDERERVEAAGGRVINWNGSRVQGVLATSRSIGDHYLKPYVISEPEVTIIERTELDDFLIIASDGLWDMISNEVACEVVQKCLKCKNFSAIRNGNFAAEAASIIAELAIARGSKDNISVIVVELRKLSCTSSS